MSTIAKQPKGEQVKKTTQAMDMESIRCIAHGHAEGVRDSAGSRRGVRGVGVATVRVNRHRTVARFTCHVVGQSVAVAIGRQKDTRHDPVGSLAWITRIGQSRWCRIEEERREWIGIRCRTCNLASHRSRFRLPRLTTRRGVHHPCCRRVRCDLTTSS